MSTLLDYSTANMTDLNNEVKAVAYYSKNLPDLPKEGLLELRYWIKDAEEGGYNLYYWQNGVYKVRHFAVIQGGTRIINGGCERFGSLEAFLDNSFTHDCHGEEMGTDLLPSL
ncbi:MAG: hypothetical protein WB791_09080 [Waddliaceae bacterium]